MNCYNEEDNPMSEHNRLKWLCSDERWEIIQRLRQRVAAEARPRHRGVSHTLLCLSCKYYNPTTQAYLRCAVHPEGPKSDTCPDKEER
jgi:hypothetical protein